jgi:hypothetical protein
MVSRRDEILLIENSLDGALTCQPSGDQVSIPGGVVDFIEGGGAS